MLIDYEKTRTCSSTKKLGLLGGPAFEGITVDWHALSARFISHNVITHSSFLRLLFKSTKHDKVNSNKIFNYF